MDLLKIREERIKSLMERGYTGNINTGKVYNKKGIEVITKNSYGYKRINTSLNGKSISITQHQFIWYVANKEVIPMIDHINSIRDDNRIINLRSSNPVKNGWNRGLYDKGYCWSKNDNKWKSYIKVNNKAIHLGYFLKEEDARKAYLEAKKKYHII